MFLFLSVQQFLKWWKILKKTKCYWGSTTHLQGHYSSKFKKLSFRLKNVSDLNKRMTCKVFLCCTSDQEITDKQEKPKREWHKAVQFTERILQRAPQPCFQRVLKKYYYKLFLEKKKKDPATVNKFYYGSSSKEVFSKKKWWQGAWFMSKWKQFVDETYQYYCSKINVLRWKN